MALTFQLEQSAWWSSDALRSHQQIQLRSLLRHAAETVPFYMDRLAGADVDTWEHIPLLSRRELQLHAAELRSRAFPKQHGSVQRKQTSGSTGRPVVVLSSGVTETFWSAITLRDHLWHDRDLDARLAAIRHVPEADAVGARPPAGIRVQGWGPATDAMYPDAPLSLLGIEASVDEQLAWLVQEAPVYLLTHPENLHALLRAAEHAAVTLPSLREVRTVSETLRDETRELCEDVLGVAIADVYSTQEVGYIALQCPQERVYHVQSESVLVEVLDDNAQPCAPGEVGRVVVTALHNFATPLIRYDIGDYAEVGAPCVCGRGLPVLTRILGRQRNMLHYPDGRTGWPLILSSKLRAAAPYQQLQLEQLTRQRIVVRVVPEGELDQAHEQALIAALTACLGFAFDFDVQRVARIERGVGEKFEELISRIDGST